MATTESAPLTLPRLEAHLWQAADLFRNKVSNQKDYILALLFFKRASDLYREELEAAREELGDIANAEELARDPAFHVLLVPEGQSWDDVRNTDEALQGQALNDALAAIGRANPKQLAGVFERTDFNNKMALPSDDLARIVEHFHKLGPLDSKHVDADVLGQAYEWLIAKFAAASGKGGGEFYTPAEVGKLAAGLLEPEDGAHIYDPTCGSGGLLLQCLVRAEKQGVNVRSLFLYGQELNPETWAIARMNMLLHGAGDAAEIKLGDTLAAPAFAEGDRIKTFDLVVANPPFSSKNWGHERLKKSGDPFGRIKHLPPKSHGEVAFLQHMVASMNDKARLAVVLPNGVFFRRGAELAVRRDLIDADIVEAIIQLPKDLFYGAGIPACVLLCNRAKPPERRERLLFVDASACFERIETKNVLTNEGIDAIVAACRDWSSESGFSAVVAADEVREHRFSLKVKRYVRPKQDEVAVRPLAEVVAELRNVVGESHQADETLLENLERLGSSAGNGDGPARVIETAVILEESFRMATKLATATHEALVGAIDTLLVPLGDWDDLPAGWELEELADIADVQLGFTKGRKLKGPTRTLPYMRAKNVQAGFLALGDVAEVEVMDSELPKLALRKNDVLLLEGGNAEHVGRGWIWSGELTDCVFQNSVIRVRVHDPERLDPRFVAYAINSGPAREHCLDEASQTSNVAHLGLEGARSMPLAIPPKEQQAKIVALLDAMRAALFDAREKRDALAHLRPDVPAYAKSDIPTVAPGVVEES